MVFGIVRKLNSPTASSKWKIISATYQNFSSSTGYTQEELEQFRKVFRTLPSYEETISSKDVILFLQSINFIKPMETYQKYIKFADKALGGRVNLTVAVKYMQVQHDNCLLVNEYLITLDRDNDGFITKEEYKLGMETLSAHDPRIKNISYENFLEEADTNKDGKISVSECRVWLHKKLESAL